MTKNAVFPYLLILTCGLLWGVTFSLALIATADGTSAVTLTAWQVVLSAMIFIVICWIKKIPPFRFKHLKHYSTIAVLGIVAPDLLYYNAAPHLSAGILSVTVSTVPVFTYFIMWVLRYEALVLKRAMGILLGMVAILLLVIPDQGFASDDASFWILLVVLCAIGYSAENVFIEKGVGDRMPITEILSGSTIVASVALGVMLLWTGVGVPVSWIWSISSMAIVATAAISVIAYSLFFYTIGLSGSVFASQTAYIVTLSGVLWGILLFAEEHSIWVRLSIVVMMIGITLVTPTEKEGAKARPPQQAD